tara:strand:- start:178 stop:603 length:426 start_codon:yes stop_codon:yes gene_type:complete
MSQPDDGRYKSRGRKERTPEQLKVLAMAREKAKLVIQERTKIKKEMAVLAETLEEVSVPVEESTPVLEDLPSEVPVPAPVLKELPLKVPAPVEEPPAPVEVSVPPPLSRDEIQNLIHSTLDERRPHERKYAFVDGMYVKIK